MKLGSHANPVVDPAVGHRCMWRLGSSAGTWPLSRSALCALAAGCAAVLLASGCGKAPNTEQAPFGLIPEALAQVRKASEPASPPPTSADTRKNLPAAVYPYPPNGVVVGQGWDTFNDAGTPGSCVEVQAARLERSTYASDVRQVQSSLSLLRDVATSVSASYKGAGAKASASVSKSSSRQIKTDDQNFLFTFESADGSTFAVPPGTLKNDLNANEAVLKALAAMQPPNDRLVGRILEQAPAFGAGRITLTKDASELLKRPDEFRKACGEGFVAAIHRGVRIHVVLTQANATRKERDALTATLSASGYGGSGRASYSQTTERSNASSNLGYRVFQEGGIPVRPQALKPTNPPSVFDVNLILPTTEQLLANPTAFRVVVVPYANIDPRAAESLSTPIQLLTVADYYVALTDVFNLVRDILAARPWATGNVAPGQFNSTVVQWYGGAAGLERLLDEIHADLAFVEALLDKCYQTRRACSIKESTREVGKDLERLIPQAVAATAAAAAKSGELKNSLERLKKALPSVSSAELSKTQSDVQRTADDLDQARFQEMVQRFLDSIDEDGEPSLGFYLRFYWYLTQIPLPSSEWNPNTTVPSAAEAEKRLAALNEELVDKVMLARIAPWKSFFCDELKSEPLCVPDGILRSMAELSVVKLDNNAIVVKPPPPPPKRKKCRFPKCLRF